MIEVKNDKIATVRQKDAWIVSSPFAEKTWLIHGKKAKNDP